MSWSSAAMGPRRLRPTRGPAHPRDPSKRTNHDDGASRSAHARLHQSQRRSHRLRMRETLFTRRSMLRSFAAFPAATSLRGQELIGEPPGRIAPLGDLVNIFEVLAMARRKLPEHLYTTIAGSERRALERITFRPRLMVDVTKLDL